MGMMDTIGRVYTMSKTKKAQELLSTIESNNVEKVKELLEEGADANATVGKDTALMEACRVGSVAMVQTLLEYGAEPNQEPDNSYCLLLVMNHDVETWMPLMKILLKAGADPNSFGQTRYAPLHVAAKYGHQDAVELLLFYEADINLLSKQHQTPLDWNVASWDEEYPSVEDFLLAQGATLGPWNQMKRAIDQGSLETCKEILPHYHDLNDICMDGWWPLRYAIFKRDLPIVAWLLEQGALPDIGESKNEILFAMDKLEKYQFVEGVKLLLKGGANPESLGVFGYAALHHAAKHGLQELTEILLEHGANINVLSDEQQTPLDWFHKFNVDNPEYHTFLRENGALRFEEVKAAQQQELLGSLVGLDTVKKKIRELHQYISFLKLRKEPLDTLKLHMLFAGNPGTGKTTVARILGEYLATTGLLSKGHVHEVSRAELVGQYTGQTAPKTIEALDKAQGGILFVDDAPSLVLKEDSYGLEAIRTLSKEITERSDLLVIVSGYPSEIDSFLDSSPGLRSRFKYFLNFEDFTPDELLSIGTSHADELKIVLAPEAKKQLMTRLVEAYRTRTRNFGNARYIQDIIEESKLQLGLRVMEKAAVAMPSEEELSLVLPQDIEKAFSGPEEKPVALPIDENQLQESLDELFQLVGLEPIKKSVRELAQLAQFYREVNKDVAEELSQHVVFMGNPGTGKTTVARILANLYKALGILERGHLVECDRSQLVAEYVGQTARKTNRVIDEAIGGLLFIDEAYTLTAGSHNDYGREALEALLKRMEDDRGKFAVVVAGYPELMNQFLQANPGLRSRFDKTFWFHDYTAEELVHVAEFFLQKSDMEATSKAKRVLHQLFDSVVRDESFGNARLVRKVVEQATQTHHLRLSTLSEAQRTSDSLRYLLPEDLPTELDDEALKAERAPIGFQLK